jgi:hypothetical protein
MSTNEVSNNEAAESTNVANAAMKLEARINPANGCEQSLARGLKSGVFRCVSGSMLKV